jgi:YgiT-type zinc finger domain-containing protein
MARRLQGQERAMKCVICRPGKTNPGLVTVSLQRGESSIIYKGVPAEVCENCGEYCLSEMVTERLLAKAEEAVKNGAEVEILRFAA